jgi:hypothetical protein
MNWNNESNVVPVSLLFDDPVGVAVIMPGRKHKHTLPSFAGDTPCFLKCVVLRHHDLLYDKAHFLKLRSAYLSRPALYPLNRRNYIGIVLVSSILLKVN